VAVERTVAAQSGEPTGEPVGSPAAPAALAGPGGQVDWRGDIALELWVEADADPARVRLAGRLDATTAANLTQVVAELLAEGRREFELITEGLRVVDASAVGVLADIERLIRRAGGTLTRIGPSMGPFARGRRGVSPPATRP